MLACPRLCYTVSLAGSFLHPCTPVSVSHSGPVGIFSHVWPIMSMLCHHVHDYSGTILQMNFSPPWVGQHQGPAAASYLCALLAGQWAPHLARLDNTGSINAWSTNRNNAWIQVRGAAWLEAPLGHCKGTRVAAELCRRTRMVVHCFPNYILLFPLLLLWEVSSETLIAVGLVTVAAGLAPDPSSVHPSFRGVT